ncbi:MAG: hypothetical protein KC912_10660 [Proteobacteria bacterium]|nr:hypothetical protein [Pseudomonadota bacterium]
MNRVSGLSICDHCASVDPRDTLIERGFAVEWEAGRMAWSASLHVPGLAADFELKCVPELWRHKALKWLVDEVEVGDPTFDRHIYVRTNDVAHARKVLTESVQIALLGLLTGLRADDWGNGVALTGKTLSLHVNPESGLGPDRIQQLRLDAAALALHLRAGRTAT